MAENVNISILFADVCGSTRLYEMLGDQRAQQVIGECIAFMLEVVEQYGGTLVKTIGDEIMVRFDDANQAVRAACEIQEENESGRQYAGHRISLRAGLHHGPAILDDGDVFGDAVNVAARMAGIAKATQVITTGDTVALLDPDLAEMAREFDRTTVKGKTVELRICEILWEADDVTTMNVPSTVKPAADEGLLLLRCGDQEVRVGASERPVVTLGRGSQADMVVQAPLASRVHCRFESRRGKFVVVDQSTNGTFVRTADGESVYLRREELLIWGSGCIALGEDVSEANQHLIHFTCP
ncbi:MAG: adenylate/guanylate cyclase domain-containing protein [Gammaproteobacteria bacterium]|nr:adenylate/guanylate cyclase domain-containing protein [Gammaproteobacteria bacterium]